MLIVEYRGNKDISVDFPLPRIGSLGMLEQKDRDFWEVKFPYRCFEGNVSDEELTVILPKKCFVDADLFVLDAINKWAEEESEKQFDKLLAFMKAHAQERDKIKKIFGEELSEKMFDFYEKNG